MTIEPESVAAIACVAAIVALLVAFWFGCLWIDCRNFRSERDRWRRQAEGNGKELSVLREKLVKLARGE